MNILLINDFAYVDGGASKICLGSARALAERGHNVLLFCAVGPVDPALLDVDNLEVECLHQHEIVDDPQRLRAAITGLWNGNSAESLERRLARLSAADTIVHVHTWTKALSSSVIASCLKLGFPVVLTLHDYFSVCPTGGFFIHPQQKICHLKPMSVACLTTNCDSRSYGHKLWRIARQWVQEHFGKLPAGIKHFISISTLSESILRPLLPADAQIHRVSNFNEIEKSDPVDVDQNELVCFVGRLSPEKGPQLLAQCAQAHNLPVRFIGDGPLKQEVINLAPHAEVTGWLAPEQVHVALRSARMLVFPSLWYETQGLVVAEAAAMGIPVIVPSTSAAAEWVIDGESGLIFEGGDILSLTEKMLQLRDTAELAAAMGRNAYKTYWANPATMSRHCNELEQVYRAMLS